jgi:hypothetical protein
VGRDLLFQLLGQAFRAQPGSVITIHRPAPSGRNSKVASECDIGSPFIVMVLAFTILQFGMISRNQVSQPSIPSKPGGNTRVQARRKTWV